MSEKTGESTGSLDRRGQTAGIAGLCIQGVLLGLVLLVGLWPRIGSDAVVTAAVQLAGGIPIWIILIVILSLQQRSRLEDLETEQLRRMQQSGLATNIFDVGDETMLLQRRRLTWTYRFLLPAITIITAAYHLYVGGSFLVTSWQTNLTLTMQGAWARSENPFGLMLLMAGVAVLCFAYSRYVLGMARQPQWRLLRAGGTYLMANTLSATIVLVAMVLSQIHATRMWAEPLAALVIRVGMVLLGLEILANFVLDFYRPRRPGEEIRPAFDSRLLSLFGEPGGVMRSIATTINYQFGFEVSSTWFYQLVQRSLFPLVVLTAVALMLLSSVVVVDVDEQAYIERFGELVQPKGEALKSGFNLKWPWPIDRVARQRVDMVRTLVVGSESGDAHGEESHEDEDGGHGHGDEAILWGEKHESNPEMLMIVASPGEVDRARSAVGPTDGRTESRARSVAVSLLMISLQIEYRIRDLYDFTYGYVDPERVLESISYQELSRYAAGISSADLMGKGRREFDRMMRHTLQERCEELGLGIDLVFVTLQEAHPPSESEVASTFQNVVAAEIRKSAAIASARGNAQRILTLTAGSVDRARELDEAIQRRDGLTAGVEGDGDAAVALANARVDALLFGDPAKNIGPASGEVAGEIARARAGRAIAVSGAESKVRSFRNDVAAYQAAPSLYKMRRYLQLLGDVLPHIRKYVFTTRIEPGEVVVEFDTQERGTLDLDTSAIK